MHNILDIAKYIINKSIDINKPTNNLKLQKILYYIDKEYVIKFNKFLFNIKAYKITSYGIMFPDVYYEFNIYGSSDIIMKQNINVNFSLSEIDLMNSVIYKYKDYSAIELVNINKKDLTERNL